MQKYVKPESLVSEDISEGVFASSGATGGDNAADKENGGIKCDSKYMNGKWQAPDYSQWANGETRGYKQQFACLGCPANTGSGCGLETHYIESGNAASYEVYNGNRKPSWEKKGYGPNDPVTDWAM